MGPDGRAFDDFTATRNNVFDNVLNAARAIKPMEYGGRRLELTDVDYDPADLDDEGDKFSYGAQSNAIREKQTMGRRLRGTFLMTDLATGEQQSEQRLLAVVPRVNEDGTMLYRGSRYAFVNQQRLKPASYGRVKKNQELEVFNAVKQGTGPTHRYIFDPDRSVFYFSLGNSRIPLASVLKTLGATDDDLKTAWGEEIAAKNIKADNNKNLQKIFEHLGSREAIKTALSDEDKRNAIRESFSKMEVDPWVLKRNLGIESDRITPQVILASTRKILDMGRGDQEGDDRDSLQNQKIHSVEDFLAERISMDSGREQKNSFRKALAMNKLSAVGHKLLQKQLEDSVFGSGLAILPENPNPLSAWSTTSRITKLGEGGVGSTDAIPKESRDYNASHAGYFDPAVTVECFPSHSDVMTRTGWVSWPEVNKDTEFACMVDGRLEFHRATKLHRSAYVGNLYGYESKRIAYEVTPDHRMWVACAHIGSEFRFERASEMHGKNRVILCAGHEPYIGSISEHPIKSPICHNLGPQARKDLPATFSMSDWAEFIGWVVTEGSTGGKGLRGGKLNLGISQCKFENPENYARICRLLEQMRIPFTRHDRGVRISRGHLATYCASLGLISNEKYFPREMLEWPISARRRLACSMMLGDGGTDNDDTKWVYHSSSERLASEMELLAFGLGYSSNVSSRSDDRKETYFDMHRVQIHRGSRRQLRAKPKNVIGYYIKPYSGEIHCATVPGGLLYCRRDSQCKGFWSGNSSRIGVDLNVGSRTVKGKDGRIYTPLINARTGQTEYVAAEDMADKVLAPDKETDIPGHYSAIKNGSEDYYSKDEIDYFLPDKETAFAGISNLVPLKMMQPHNRTAMGQRFISQSVPLLNPEAPLVRSAVPGTGGQTSFESLYRERVGVVSAKVGGVVKQVKPDRIVIESQGEDGKPILKTHWLHEHTSLGAKTAMINKPIVEVGQQVSPDDVLATSNFSDAKGDIAMGVNARMALMPWGDNYEDAYVISQSFAKRLSSHQSYDHRREFNADALIHKNKFISALPSAYNKEQLAKLDDHGVVQVGQVLKNGDPVMLSATRKAVNMAKPLMRTGHRAYQDQSQVWDHENDGTVTAVHRDARGNVHVSVDTHSPAIDADKLAELYGTKGVAKIIPDDQMVHDAEGRPFDIVSSDLGLISRKNSSRAVAMWLGKVAQKTGNPIFIDEDDDTEEIMDRTYRLMKEHGVTPTETVIDPKTGRKIPGVATGPQFIMKLTHQAESKANARALGAYDANGQPAKGADDGMQAKRVSNQELGALMAHGSMSYLQEIGTVKGSKNEEWAARFMAGKDLPAVEVPMAYNKFLSYVKGMGVNPVRTGSVTRLWLMNNNDIDQLSGGRQVREADTVNLAKDLKPISGGLFDPAIFGDDGKKFAMYQLATPIPHPSMEKPLLKVMNITGKQFRGVLSGKEELGEYGTGVQAISKFLENLDIGKEKAKAIHKIRTGARTAKDAAIQQYRYLSAIEKHGLKPSELIIDKVPILPPIYRPISKLAGKDTPLIDGLNHLYQQMIYADQNQREIGKYADDDSEERLATYDAVQAAMGLQEPADKELRQKNVKGIMKKLVGPNPKNSFVQGKLLSHTVDSVGRGVALPNAQLKLNEIGIPEEQAWKIFEMPMMRQLTRRGISVTEAKEAIEQRKSVARDALEREMSYRPVTASRAPVLHKFGIMGFMPRLVEGYSLQFNPLVHPAYNLDHDGDTMNFHAVITDEAVKEVKEKMLPTSMLFSPADFESPMFVPRQDHGLGLYLASTAKEDRRPVSFVTMKDAFEAFQRGEINVNTPIRILKK